jgi:hypothetical protein
MTRNFVGAGNAPALRLSKRVTALVAAGAAIALAGSVMPWMTIFRGTQSLSGWDGAPRYLGGAAVASALVTALYVRGGRQPALRRLAILAAIAAVAGTLVQLIEILTLGRTRSVTARILDVHIGPGPFVMLAGSLMLLGVLAISASASRLASGSWPRLIMAALLFTTGWIHIALTPEHLSESTILGTGFLAAGLAQVVLSVIIAVKPSALAYYAVVGSSVALIVLYAIAVVHGLPFGSGHDHAYGLILGSGEPVDLEGAVSKLAELGSLAIAFVLLGGDACPQAVRRVPA